MIAPMNKRTGEVIRVNIGLSCMGYVCIDRESLHWNLVVTIEPSQLLNDVSWNANIKTEAWRSNSPRVVFILFEIEIKKLEFRLHPGRVEIKAEHF